MKLKHIFVVFVNIFAISSSIRILAIELPNVELSNGNATVFISYEESYETVSESLGSLKAEFGLLAYLMMNASLFSNILNIRHLFQNYCAAKVIRLFPLSHSDFQNIINLISGQMESRWRKWSPHIIIRWPNILNANATIRECSPNGTTTLRLNVTEYIYKCYFVPVVLPTIENLKTFEIHLNFYIEFKIASNDDILPNTSVWEIYFLNGIDSSRLNVQEIYRGKNVNAFDLEASRVSRRANFHSMALKIIAPNFDDTKYHLAWASINGVNQLVGGISWEILQDLEYCMNFRSNIIEGDWITQAVNESLNGTTAKLITTRHIDLMIGQAVPIIKRAEMMDYLQPTSANTIRAFVNQPPASAISDIFVNPFKPQLRLYLGALALLVLIIVQLISWILPNYGNHYTLEDKRFKSESCMWLIACVTQQGWYTHPRSFPLRLVFITSAITALFCYIAYAAKIVSVLSVESTLIKNLTEIFRSHLTLYAAADSVTIKELIMGFQSQERNLKVLSVPLNLGVFLLFQSPSAFISYTHRYHEERKSKGISDYRACQIYAFPLTMSALPSAMGLPKKSPLREYFNYKILVMKEKGLIDRYQKKTKIINGLNCDSSTNRYRSDLGIMDVLTAFIALCSGFALCLGLLISECIYFYKFSQKINRRLQFSFLE